MFRIPRHLMNARRIIKYNQHIIGANLKACNGPRDCCPPQECPPRPSPAPPPPPKPADDSALWGTLAVLIIAASFSVYAKSNPELRDWLTIYAPWFDDLIAALYQENITYEESAWKFIENVKKSINCIILDVKTKICPVDETTPTLTNNTAVEIEKKDDTNCDEPVELVSFDISSVIECATDRTEVAIRNYNTALTACTMFNKAIEESTQNYGATSGKALKDHMVERRKIVNRSVKYAEDASQELSDLLKYLEGGRVIAPDEDIKNASLLIRENERKIKAASIKFVWENDKSQIMDQLWSKIKQGTSKYVQETEMLFPEVNYAQNKLAFAGDIDLLLHHSLRYCKSLRNKLDEAASGMTDRIHRAIGLLPQGEEQKKLRDRALQASILQKRLELNKEILEKYENLQKKNEKFLADSLQAQAEQFEKDLENKLEMHDKMIHEKIDTIIAEKVEFENRTFKRQLEEMEEKVGVVEKKLHASSTAGHNAKESRELYQAGVALLEATRKGGNYVNVNKELKAIEKAADGDEFITTVLKTIPPSVREKGLVPESALRKQYQQMEEIAMKVALVEAEGSPLPVYFLSWLQSMLLFFKPRGIPQEEYEKPGEASFKDLDTFDLLQRARFWMGQGNVAVAIRYVESLEGASRVAANTWYEAALAHLQTRQAAEVLLAHAVSIGLKSM